MALKAKLQDYYRKNGGIVYVYFVTGTPDELAAYKAAKKQYYREDKDGNVLMFSPRALSNNRNEVISLNITANGNVVADDLNKVLDQNATLEKYILKEQAKMIALQAFGRGGVKAVAKLTAQPQAQELPEDFEDAIEEQEVEDVKINDTNIPT